MLVFGMLKFHDIKDATGEWKRKGDAARMIRNISALLYLQQEHRFAIHEDNTNMVKFMTSIDKNYQTVVLYIRECLDQYLTQRCK